MTFGPNVLRLDGPAELRKIDAAIRGDLAKIRRRGLVLGLSGGIDSSVVAALAARAIGPERVLAILMPERDSHSASLELGKLMADHLGIGALIENIRPALEAIGCYARQDEAIRTVFPEYGESPGYTCKLTLPSILDSDRLNVFQLTVRAPDGTERTSRMSADAYRQLVAATNFKQRVRKSVEYYHADRLHYAVAGTPNRLEYDQGFFVKQGDGMADIKPIAHLYKTQVYELAEELGIPDAIRSRPPTTDTFSMEQTQEEFFFALPYDKMDLCLWAKNHGVSAEEAARVVGLEAGQIDRVFRDIDAKRRTTVYLHTPPLLVEPIRELAGAH